MSAGEEGRAPSGSVWNDKKHAQQLGLNPKLDHIHHVYGSPFQILYRRSVLQASKKPEHEQDEVLSSGEEVIKKKLRRKNGGEGRSSVRLVLKMVGNDL